MICPLCQKMYEHPIPVAEVTGNMILAVIRGKRCELCLYESCPIGHARVIPLIKHTTNEMILGMFKGELCHHCFAPI